MKIIWGKVFGLGISLCLIVGASGSVCGQDPVKETYPPKPPRAPRPQPKVFPPGTDGILSDQRVTSEKSLAVDPNLSVKMCVLDGRVEINGWSRNELRVFVKNGTRTNLRIQEKDPTSGKPNWIFITRMVSAGGRTQECLAGESVEIDAPAGASFRLEGHATRMTIDSVRRVTIKNVEGSIALRNITGGISAVAYQGDVAVENSSGAIALESTNGNIAAFGVNPGQIGDLFRVKTTSGAISLQKVEHRQIDANSITGSVFFNGKLLVGGLYNFKTSNGSIRMLIPGDSSLMLKAVYGLGTFNSELPLKVLTEDITPQARILVGTIGNGDATVNLTTSSGSIGIRKQ
ncbi:MAG: DUF4097 domain-containing protein [Acidobacteria bacterium]|nr:DUF4097 domain-containing protein [Acidobacteriota bacterium]